VLDGPFDDVTPVSEARLKPNDLTQPDTTHYSLTAVYKCDDANTGISRWKPLGRSASRTSARLRLASRGGHAGRC